MAARRTKKISALIWKPVRLRFEQSVEEACLRRDPFLSAVLREELEELDDEVAAPNSEAGYRRVHEVLDELNRKFVCFTLDEDVVERLNEICARKRIVRDAFFNRLLYLLALGQKDITRLFFDGDGWWTTKIFEDTDFKATTAYKALRPIPVLENPFGALREGLRFAREDDERKRRQKVAADYTVWGRDLSIEGGEDLSALSCLVPETIDLTDLLESA